MKVRIISKWILDGEQVQGKIIEIDNVDFLKQQKIKYEVLKEKKKDDKDKN